ncbi:MAG: sulfatase family protein [Rubrobacteraceae bacterium]
MRKVLTALVLVMATLAIGCSSGSALVAERPNIVFILTDDMRLDELDHMPKTEALLADQGVTFSNAFVSYPTCCPSRASILRGQYARNHRVLANTAPKGGFQRFEDLGHERSTVATWLDDAGYDTALLGKYLNEYDARAVPPGWDEWFARISPEFTYYDYDVNENGAVVHYGSRESDYYTDVLSRQSRSYIDDAARDERPFFAYIAPLAPHGPTTPAERHEDMFAGSKAPRAPSFDEGEMGDKPRRMRNKPLLNRDEKKRIDREHRDRLRTLQAVDEMVAGIARKLRTQGELDNTYIVFTSDNGWHKGEHRLPSGKRTPYEEAIRVPLVVRGPGVPAGQTRDELTLNTDFAPTFADLARAEIPDFVDGRSLKPLLTGPPPKNWRTGFLIENHYPEGDSILGVRAGKYKYIEHPTGRKELYDLSSDPHELESIHKTAPPALLKRLESRLEALNDCSGESCRAAEDGRSAPKDREWGGTRFARFGSGE